MERLWETEALTKTFTSGGNLWRPSKSVYALNQVSLYQNRGETLGIVGESGCGKSTFGRVLMGLYPKTSGRITVDGRDIETKKDQQFVLQRMQMVFQDPFASLNPRMTVKAMLEEPLAVHTKLSAKERQDKVYETLELVGLQKTHGERYAHEFSGGQRQRVGIARALILEPDCIICDEPISALDVSIQVQIVTLLERLQAQKSLSYVFISHDLNMVHYLSHRMAVMYLGTVLEEGTVEELYKEPLHPYTQALLALNGPVKAHAPIGPVLQGEVPNPLHLPEGCLFSGRCHHVTEECLTARPVLTDEGGRRVACWKA